ncbi:MAG: TlpA disulfide reductase family protein [Myxococcota bacterium]
MACAAAVTALACGPKPAQPSAAEGPAPAPAVAPTQAAAPTADEPAAAPAPKPDVESARPPAPRVAELPAFDRDGLIAHIKQKGARATVVTVWATWCVPCIEEMPMLARYYDAHRADGLEILGLSLDDRTTAGDKIQRVLDRVRVSYPMAVIATGQAEAFISATSPQWDGMLPAAILFDAEGTQRGFVTEQLSEEGLAELVKPLLAR